MSVPSGKQPAPGPLARAISATLRSIMADRRITARDLAAKAGLSRSYLGKRLRDEASLTANDVEAICAALNEDLMTFVTESVRRMRR